MEPNEAMELFLEATTAGFEEEIDDEAGAEGRTLNIHRR